MPKHSKRFNAAAMAIRAGAAEPQPLTIAEAVERAVSTASAKFDETVEVAVRLSVDPRKADQNVRGAVVLPHGTGNRARVLVLARGPKEKEAADAGADYVGNDEYLKKIQEGWLEFEALIATPDMMRDLGRLGKVLGPRGLMPSPKTGSVTVDVAKAVEDAKAGKIEFRVDKAGIVHAGLGKVSFGADKVRENLMALLNDLQRRKPSTSKGVYFKSLAVATTMGPGVKVDPAEVRALA